MEYIHIGTNKIYKELWQNIRMDQTYNNHIKPYGGLYCSNKSENICDWLDYVRIENKDFYKYIFSKPSCIIKLKEDAKILNIENKEDIEILRNNNLIIDKKNNPITINKYYYSFNVYELPNYEKISELFDAIIINPDIDKTYSTYSIKTIIITNPNAIEYYKPIILENGEIKNIGNKEFIPNISEDYYKYYEYIKKNFFKITTSDYREYIRILNLIRDTIKNDKNYLYDKLGFNINNNIDNIKLLEAVTHNVYREEYLNKQKILHISKNIVK